MIKSVFFIICLFIIFNATGQAFTFPNQFHYGTSGFDGVGRITKCQDGGYLVAFSSAGNNHDKSNPGYGGDDFWIVRLNANKSLRWEKTFGGNNSDEPLNIVELQDGSIAIAGRSESGISGVKTTVNYGGIDYWFVRLDANGNKLHDKSYGSSLDDRLQDMVKVEDNKFLLIGYSNTGVSGSKTDNGQGSVDIWVVAVDSVGTELWQKTYGGTGGDANLEMRQILLQNGNPLLVGGSNSGIGGNKTTPHYGMGDAWLIEINPMDGNILQQASFGGDTTDVLYDVAQIGNNIYLAGYSNSGISGNKQSPLIGIQDAWVLKLDQNLSVIKDTTFGNVQNYLFTGVSANLNELFFYGYASNDGNPLITTAMNNLGSIWVVCLDTDLNHKWNFTFGSADGIDDIRDVFQDSPNNYTFGFVSNTAGNSGDVVPVSYGSYDLYMVEVHSVLGLVENFEFYNSVYPNPIINSFAISNLPNGSHFEIFDMQGKFVLKGVYNNIIDVTSLEKGMYQVAFTFNNQKIIKKFVKE